MPDKTYKLSVIVPCHKPGPYLERLLESLAEQKMEGEFEIVLIDNSREGRIAPWIEKASRSLNLKTVRADARANGSYARNRGVAAAKGEFICFVDADDEIAPGYVNAMTNALRSHELVTSRVDLRTLNADWVFEAQGSSWAQSGVDIFFGFLPSGGINIALRRSLFESLGGFDEAYSGSQDIEFCWRAQLERGVRIEFVPEAVYRYRYRESLLGLYRQTRNWGFSNVLLYAKFRERGMPGRSIKQACRDWAAAAKLLVQSRQKAVFGSALIQLGYCVGRMQGALRYRTLYL